MIKKIIFIFFLVILLAPSVSLAQNEEQIQSFEAEIKVNSDSTILVKEKIHYFFASPKHGISRHIPQRYLDKEKNKYFSTQIENIQVIDADNHPWSYSQSQDQNYLVLKIGDADKTVEGAQTYIISYQITGVLNYFSDHDELYWNVTGNDWEVPIGQVIAKVTLPENAANLKATCYTGAAGSLSQNCEAQTAKNIATYTTPTGPLTIVAGWDKGVVTTIERIYEISLRHESPWFYLLTLFTFIFLLFLYFKNGRDPAGRGTIAPEFEPPDNLKPAQMGTLVDEKADNLDISATIIDLAVRGYLKIRHQDKKYTLIKTKEADGNLSDFEKDIFSAIFSGKKEVDLDEIYKDFSDLGKIKDDLYQNLIDKKYFLKNPAKVRNYYFIFGFIVIFISGFFFWFSWNLVAAIVLSGIMILIFAFFMPKKTREGVIAKEKSLGFKEFLYRAERYRVRWQEKEEVFEKYLPYAMIFGIAEIWAKNFSSIYKNPPDWYEGNFTTFSAVVFAHEISSFSQTANSSFSPPATSASSGMSGFGGGGSSGGGFGGGGGGSW